MYNKGISQTQFYPPLTPEPYLPLLPSRKGVTVLWLVLISPTHEGMARLSWRCLSDHSCTSSLKNNKLRYREEHSASVVLIVGVRYAGVCQCSSDHGRCRVTSSGGPHCPTRSEQVEIIRRQDSANLADHSAAACQAHCDSINSA